MSYKKPSPNATERTLHSLYSLHDSSHKIVIKLWEIDPFSPPGMVPIGDSMGQVGQVELRVTTSK